MQDAQKASGSLGWPDVKRESPPPDPASAKAAIAAAETAAAPTEVVRTNRHRSDRLKPSDDHLGGADVASLSTFATTPASRIQITQGRHTPR